LLVSKPQKMYLSSVLKECSRKIGVSKYQINKVVDGYYNQIRDMDSTIRSKDLIIGIALISEQYGGRKDINEDVLDACIDLVENRFGFLSVAEIKTAYEMWASGEIKINGAEMYGGEFNAGQLGKVLGGYRDYRKNIIAVFLKEKEEKEREEKEKQRAQILKEKFNQEFPKKIAQAKKNFTTWQAVPPFWFDTMKKRGWINLSKEEYQKIWNQSFDLALEEMKNRKEKETNIFKKYNGDDLLAIRKNISKQIAVFDKIIKNKKWAIPQKQTV